MLSPADLNGVRARQFLSPSARARAAVTLRSGDGVPIADAFTFISGLYFRGKFAYARRFAAPPASWEDEGIYVIAPGFGLVPPSWPLDKIRLRRLRRIPVDLRSRAYRRPLRPGASFGVVDPPAFRTPISVIVSSGRLSQPRTAFVISGSNRATGRISTPRQRRGGAARLAR